MTALRACSMHQRSPAGRNPSMRPYSKKRLLRGRHALRRVNLNKQKLPAMRAPAEERGGMHRVGSVEEDLAVGSLQGRRVRRNRRRVAGEVDRDLELLGEPRMVELIRALNVWNHSAARWLARAAPVLRSFCSLACACAARGWRAGVDRGPACRTLWAARRCSAGSGRFVGVLRSSACAHQC